ncbi:hypothetical protein C9374_011394 [Naegleria lovaniensis]|uniref:Uncharacterized protein n=1 Tax=Naegleria lovaniensis TaxID=51637 RepID=A0AA88GY22_NAELO|nr:uncharacterized protein C9374_011394 [Naegleria lovaniensis]KAG2392669.1 hypothetical protein C9374_011394 [Naegleria lovaniensis]
MFSFEEEASSSDQKQPTTLAPGIRNNQEEEEFTINQTQQQTQQKPQQYTPIETIDINYEKLKDWLVDRSFLASDYVKPLKQIRAYIKHAWNELISRHEELKDTQKEKEQPVAELIAKIKQEARESQEQDEVSRIDYFLTKQIVQVLEKADASEGSGFLFGLVGGSKRLKLWKHVLQSYESKSIHLAELSGYMIQNVKYELPAVASSLLTLRNQLESLDKKEEDWKRSLELTKREFAEACEKLSINKEKVDRVIEFASLGSSVGIDMEEEIKKAVFELPSLYEKIIDSCRDPVFKKAVDYYEQFTLFINKQNCSEPLLNFILSNMDAQYSGTMPSLSLYDWKSFNKEELPKYDEDKVQTLIGKLLKEEESKKQNDVEKEPEIDFGDFSTDNTNLEIQWDTNIEENKEVEIKFDDVVQEKELEIDFGDFSTDQGFSMDDTTTSISQVSNSDNEKNNQAVAEMKMRSFLDSEDIRARFSSNIFQLYAFIQQRLVETSRNSTLEADIFRNAPQAIKSLSRDELSQFKKVVANIIATLNNPHFKQLVLIKTSKKFVERLVQSLTQKVEIMSKVRSNLESVDSQRISLNSSIKKQQPTLEKLKRQTKEYQQYVQQTLSERLGKRVLIFGEINKI